MAEDELFAFRSLTSILYCHAPLRIDVHGVAPDDVTYRDHIAAVDAASPGCAPHHVQPLPYPYPGSGLAADTEHGTWAVATYLDSPAEYEQLTAELKPIPWILLLPDGHQYISTDPPGMVAAILSQFSSLRMADASLTNVDTAMAQMEHTRQMLAVFDGQGILDPADQQL